MAAREILSGLGGDRLQCSSPPERPPGLEKPTLHSKTQHSGPQAVDEAAQVTAAHTLSTCTSARAARAIMTSAP